MSERPDFDTVTRLLALAAEAATAAGAELRRRQGNAGRVEHKRSATDPVSEADRASERLLTELLLAARPEDGVLGEEGSARSGRSGLRWVLDPLDGTVNYLYGFPCWSVSLACEEASEDAPGGWRGLVAVVYDPLRREAFTAARGYGAFLEGRRLRVNDPVPLDRALVATGFDYDPALRARQGATAARLLPQVRDLRRAGSAALDLCWLAAGRVDAFYEAGRSRWDWAAGALIASEAGAVVTFPRLEGTEGILAAGPALHQPLAAALAEPSGSEQR